MCLCQVINFFFFIFLKLFQIPLYLSVVYNLFMTHLSSIIYQSTHFSTWVSMYLCICYLFIIIHTSIQSLFYYCEEMRDQEIPTPNREAFNWKLTYSFRGLVLYRLSRNHGSIHVSGAKAESYSLIYKQQTETKWHWAWCLVLESKSPLSVPHFQQDHPSESCPDNSSTGDRCQLVLIQTTSSSI